jgi:hypothetical protein
MLDQVLAENDELRDNSWERIAVELQASEHLGSKTVQ